MGLTDHLHRDAKRTASPRWSRGVSTCPGGANAPDSGPPRRQYRNRNHSGHPTATASMTPMPYPACEPTFVYADRAMRREKSAVWGAPSTPLMRSAPS